MTDAECTICHGTHNAWSGKEKRWGPCPCRQEAAWEEYWERATREWQTWRKASPTPGSFLDDALWNKPGTYIVSTIDDGGMQFAGYLKHCLNRLFNWHRENGQTPPVPKVFRAEQILNTAWDRDKDPIREVQDTRFLLIVAFSWKQFLQAWQELELLMRSRNDQGKSTLVICTSPEELGEDQQQEGRVYCECKTFRLYWKSLISSKRIIRLPRSTGKLVDKPTGKVPKAEPLRKQEVAKPPTTPVTSAEAQEPALPEEAATPRQLLPETPPKDPAKVPSKSSVISRAASFCARGKLAQQDLLVKHVAESNNRSNPEP